MVIFMDVFLLLILIAPGITSTFIHGWLKPGNDDTKRFVASTVVYTAVISIFMCLLLVLRGHALNSLSALFTTIQSTLKYGIASFVFALIIPSLFILLQKLFSRVINRNADSHKKPN